MSAVGRKYPDTTPSEKLWPGRPSLCRPFRRVFRLKSTSVKHLVLVLSHCDDEAGERNIGVAVLVQGFCGKKSPGALNSDVILFPVVHIDRAILRVLFSPPILDREVIEKSTTVDKEC